jgi:quinol monooxygenase YgiN
MTIIRCEYSKEARVFVVTVVFGVKVNHRAAFMEEMVANARQSLENEADCHQFDVCIAADDPTRVFLYEVYANRAAFEKHLQSVHFIQFDRTVRDWIASKDVEMWDKTS